MFCVCVCVCVWKKRISTIWKAPEKSLSHRGSRRRLIFPVAFQRERLKLWNGCLYFLEPTEVSQGQGRPFKATPPHTRHRLYTFQVHLSLLWVQRGYLISNGTLLPDSLPRGLLPLVSRVTMSNESQMATQSAGRHHRGAPRGPAWQLCIC